MPEGFFAFSTAVENIDFSWDCRDEEAGVLGTISTAGQPIAHAADLESIELLARAYLGREPGEEVYVADAQNRVFRILINEKHHKIVDHQSAVTAKAISLLVFCVTSLVMVGSVGAVHWTIAVFVLVSVLYLLVVKSGILNEIEAAVACEITLILLLALAGAIHERRSASQGASGVAQGTVEQENHSQCDAHWLKQEGHRPA